MTTREKEILALLAIILLFIAASNLLPMLAHTGIPPYMEALFWLSISAFVYTRPRTRAVAKLRLIPFIVILTTLSAAAAVVSTFAAGMLSSMGKSPYSKTPIGILMNLLQFASVPIMMEWVRAYLVNGVERKRAVAASAIVTLLFTLVQVNMLSIGGINNLESFASFMGGKLLPAIVLNSFLCYVVYLAGPMPAMLYMAITTLPQWFLPVLPDLNWLLTAIIGCIVPLMCLFILQDVYTKSAKLEKPARKKESPYSWLAVLAVCVLVVWFIAGLFPVYPVTIMSGSMEPLVYAGDVVIIEKADAAQMKKGDIVQYWAKDIFIIHRIIDIDKLEDQTVYITKGDNNNVRDTEPVTAEQIKGKVIATVPKLGLLTYWIRSR